MNKPYITISVGSSRASRKWRQRTMPLEEFVAKCRTPLRTPETMQEFRAMSRDEQGRVKDCGGFVGGRIEGGQRKAANVRGRTLVTLDMDYGEEGMAFLDEFANTWGCAILVYSTHKHTPQKPRLRVILFPDREMGPEEYAPVSRRWAQRLGIELFDHTSHDINRLFYWPSVSADGEFFSEYIPGGAFSVDGVLATYRDPMDSAEWPRSSREDTVVTRSAAKAGDPLSKPGIIGAFCRAHTIEDAIDTFLKEAYTPTAEEGRYTYAKGHVAGGLLCYEHKWAYSHHDTDPAGDGHVYNAFDLCARHLFGAGDEGARTTDPTKLPSYRRMEELALKDEATLRLMAEERMASAREDFGGLMGAEGDDGEEDAGWMTRLEVDRAGNYKPTMANLRLIMLNDRAFRNVRYDTFAQMETLRVTGGPFGGTHAPHDVDDSSLARMCAYLARAYGIELGLQPLCDKMLKPTAPDRGYNPVEEMIRAEQWDGVGRIDTLYSDYLGAEDTPLNRAFSRKMMVAMVGRAIDIDHTTGEGIKFDYCPVFVGPQGTGKSTFIEILAGRWRGSIRLDDSHKEQCEVLQRSLITEAPEMGGMMRAEVDKVKDLISRRSDDFRAAYARTYTKNPRHCVLIGSTNNEFFLKDTTGDRRFWVVRTGGGRPVAEWAPELRRVRGQLFAEALAAYEGGEPLYLSPELEAAAAEVAGAHNEAVDDPLREYLAEWLDIRLPSNWDSWTMGEKARFYRHYDPDEANCSTRRDAVTIPEIINTCAFEGIRKYTTKRVGMILKSLGWEYRGGRVRMTIEGPISGRDRGRDRGRDWTQSTSKAKITSTLRAQIYERPVFGEDDDL